MFELLTFSCTWLTRWCRSGMHSSAARIGAWSVRRVVFLSFSTTPPVTASNSNTPSSCRTALNTSADCCFAMIADCFAVSAMACWSFRTSLSSEAELFVESSRSCCTSFWRLRTSPWTRSARASASFCAAEREALMSACMFFSCLSKSCGKRFRTISKRCLWSESLFSRAPRRCSMDVTFVPCRDRESPTAEKCSWKGPRSGMAIPLTATSKSRCFSCNPV
mmetsp:Transcript_121987/g.379739  ORF Transcript_121987/g.379739 Transcript_121987/m.379739 type:complete len:221 (-) Transcript_121987:407-1069(-)